MNRLKILNANLVGITNNYNDEILIYLFNLFGHDFHVFRGAVC